MILPSSRLAVKKKFSSIKKYYYSEFETQEMEANWSRGRMGILLSL